MATLSNNARASIKGAVTIEKTFAAGISFLQARKVFAAGYDPLKTALVPGQGYTVVSANQVAELAGFGSQAHRMALYHAEAGGFQNPTTFVPLDVAAGGAAAQKTVTFTDNVTGAGTLIFRVGSYLLNDAIVISAVSGDTPDDVAALLSDAVNANPNLPFTATVLAGVVTLTGKTADITSDDLLVSVNLKGDEADDAPDGITVVVADTVAGAGKSSLTDFWAYIQAETTPWNTSIVTPYGDSLELDGGSAAIGNPNSQTGLYDIRDYRPASIWTCDKSEGEAGLTAALSLADGRKEDAANIRLMAPDYPEAEFEISAYVSAIVEVASMNKSSWAYTRLKLTALFGPVDPTKDWTTYAVPPAKSYDNRNLAVKGGLTPIIYKDNVAQPGDITGFWRPDSDDNKPFGKQVNRWKIWNFQNIQNINVNGDEKADRPIVNSAAAVVQSEQAIDSDILKGYIDQVTGLAAQYAWLYDGEFTVRNTSVTPSAENADRFDIKIPIVVSGNNRINAGEIQVDRNIAVIGLTLDL